MLEAAAFSALRAGYEVAAADLFADADLESHCDVTRVEPSATRVGSSDASLTCFFSQVLPGSVISVPNVLRLSI